MRKLSLALLLLSTTTCFAQVNVLTRSYNNYRTGANLAETTLTPANVAQYGLKVIATLNLTGDLRGTEGQPLIVSNFTMRDGQKHNMLYTATMGDDVFAFDADNGNLLWKQHIGNPIPDTLALDMWLIQDHWGILSTPVINLATNTIYVVDMTSVDGQESDSQFYLHGLSLLDGSDQFPPLLLNTATYNIGSYSNSFNQVPRKQRPGLLFNSVNGRDTVFIAFGSFVEDADTNRGWVIAVDVTNLQPSIAAAITTTSQYSGGGIWMAGQGMAADANGDIYGVTGNGAFNGSTEFSNAFVRLHYVPPNGTTAGSLSFVQWLAPFNDVGRVGYSDQTLADTSLIPTGGYANEPNGTSNMDSPKDEDLGSAGGLYLPESITGYSKNVFMGAGKDGILYVLDADNMGNDTNLDFAPNLIAAKVYANLLTPAYGFTYYPGNMNLEPTIEDEIQTTYGGYTHHQHGSPIFYNSPTIGPMLMTGGENGPVRTFTFNKDFSLTYQAQGGDIASANMAPPGGMPGSMLTVSANSNTPNTCIIWATQPVGNANKSVTPGYLVAYNCDHYSDGELQKIYDSRTAGAGQLTFMFDKFDIPTVANGKIYLPTYDSRIIVLGLNN